MTAPWRFIRYENALTYASFAIGVAAAMLVNGAGGRGVAGMAIAACCILDVLDGRFARMFKRSDLEKRFGGQIDSLADVAVFGVVPAVVVPRVVGLTADRLTVLTAAAYVIAGATRLGFYNINATDEADFIGAPTTLMGLLWSAMLLVPVPPGAVTCAFVVFAVAMVAPFRVPRPRGVGMIVLLLVALGLLVTHAVHALGAT